MCSSDLTWYQVIDCRHRSDPVVGFQRLCKLSASIRVARKDRNGMQRLLAIFCQRTQGEHRFSALVVEMQWIQIELSSR